MPNNADLDTILSLARSHTYATKLAMAHAPEVANQLARQRAASLAIRKAAATTSFSDLDTTASCTRSSSTGGGSSVDAGSSIIGAGSGSGGVLASAASSSEDGYEEVGQADLTLLMSAIGIVNPYSDVDSYNRSVGKCKGGSSREAAAAAAAAVRSAGEQLQYNEQRLEAGLEHLLTLMGDMSAKVRRSSTTLDAPPSADILDYSRSGCSSVNMLLNNGHNTCSSSSCCSRKAVATSDRSKQLSPSPLSSRPASPFEFCIAGDDGSRQLYISPPSSPAGRRRGSSVTDLSRVPARLAGSSCDELLLLASNEFLVGRSTAPCKDMSGTHDSAAVGEDFVTEAAAAHPFAAAAGSIGRDARPTATPSRGGLNAPRRRASPLRYGSVDSGYCHAPVYQDDAPPLHQPDESYLVLPAVLPTARAAVPPAVPPSVPLTVPPGVWNSNFRSVEYGHEDAPRLARRLTATDHLDGSCSTAGSCTKTWQLAKKAYSKRRLSCLLAGEVPPADVLAHISPVGGERSAATHVLVNSATAAALTHPRSSSCCSNRDVPPTVSPAVRTWAHSSSTPAHPLFRNESNDGLVADFTDHRGGGGSDSSSGVDSSDEENDVDFDTSVVEVAAQGVSATLQAKVRIGRLHSRCNSGIDMEVSDVPTEGGSTGVGGTGGGGTGGGKTVGGKTGRAVTPLAAYMANLSRPRAASFTAGHPQHHARSQLLEERAAATAATKSSATAAAAAVATGGGGGGGRGGPSDWEDVVAFGPASACLQPCSRSPNPMLGSLPRGCTSASASVGCSSGGGVRSPGDAIDADLASSGSSSGGGLKSALTRLRQVSVTAAGGRRVVPVTLLGREARGGLSASDGVLPRRAMTADWTVHVSGGGTDDGGGGTDVWGERMADPGGGTSDRSVNGGTPWGRDRSARSGTPDGRDRSPHGGSVADVTADRSVRNGTRGGRDRGRGRVLRVANGGGGAALDGLPAPLTRPDSPQQQQQQQQHESASMRKIIVDLAKGLRSRIQVTSRAVRDIGKR